MPKSPFVQAVDAVQAAVHAFLRPMGFRKRGRSHNRLTPGGLVHVLNFQMGEFPIGERAVIPGFRESYYGKLAVNLGVMLPCVWAAEHEQPPPEFLGEHHCTIRTRLGSPGQDEDHWFDIDDDAPALANEIVRMLDQSGLPFFDQFKNYADALAYFHTHGDFPFQNPGRAAFEAALIAHHLDDAELCRTLFHRAMEGDHLGFNKHVRAIAQQIGARID
jgi:hypothetical protein